MVRPLTIPSGYSYLGVTDIDVYVGTSGVGSVYRASLSGGGDQLVFGIASTVARNNGTISAKILYIRN